MIILLGAGRFQKACEFAFPMGMDIRLHAERPSLRQAMILTALNRYDQPILQAGAGV